MVAWNFPRRGREQEAAPLHPGPTAAAPWHSAGPHAFLCRTHARTVAFSRFGKPVPVAGRNPVVSGADRNPLAGDVSAGAGEAPTLSLVVASRGEPGALRALLGAVLPGASARGVEVVVARCGPGPETADLARAFPGARFVAVPEDATPEALRFTGMTEATGDVVMLAADDDPSAPERLAHLCRAFAAGEPAAGPADAVPTSTRSAPERNAAMERAAPPAWAAAAV